MFIVHPLYSDVLKGFTPSKLDGSALYIAIGIIGATVMPHNLYLHSSLVQTRKIENTTSGIRRALKFNFFDTVIALNLAFLANSAILILAAAAFYVNGYYKVAEIQDASILLKELFGQAAPALFAVALIAAGQSSTITGTLTGQIIMEGYLNLRIQPWLRRIITRLLAIIPALGTILFLGDSALGSLLVLSQVVLSLQLGFAVIPLIHFTSDKLTMKEFVNKGWVKILAWISASIIIYLNVQLVIEEISGWMETMGENRYLIYVIVLPIIFACAFLLLYVIIRPLIIKIQPKEKPVPHGQALDFQTVTQVHYRHIGIAIDFTGNDQKIISNALAQGGKEASYTFIHVVESASARYYGDYSKDKESKLDEQYLQKYVDDLKLMDYNSDYKIGYGLPPKAIPKIVADNHIDFLVMGSHGHKGLKDLIFGTTIDAVRHRIDIPVLIV
jgi:manganese transport protein